MPNMLAWAAAISVVLVCCTPRPATGCYAVPMGFNFYPYQDQASVQPIREAGSSADASGCWVGNRTSLYQVLNERGVACRSTLVPDFCVAFTLEQHPQGWRSCLVKGDVYRPAELIPAPYLDSCTGLYIKLVGTLGQWGKEPPGLRRTTNFSPVDVVSAIAGYDHTLVVHKNGAVSAWGSSRWLQLEIPPLLQDPSQVVSIKAGGYHSLALLANGSVVAWGQPNTGAIDVPLAAMSKVVQVAGGGEHSLVLLANGTVIAWGRNDSGQCSVPPRAQSNVVAIAGGGTFSLALLNTGEVVAWGDPRNSQVPPAAKANVMAIAAGMNHSLALLQNSSVVAWGAPDKSNLDLPPGLQGVFKVAAGSWHSLALLRNGTVVAWGSNDFNGSIIPATYSQNVGHIAAGTSWSSTIVLPPPPPAPSPPSAPPSPPSAPPMPPSVIRYTAPPVVAQPPVPPPQAPIVVSQSRDGEDTGLSAAAVAGITCGVTVGIALPAALLLWACCCRRRDHIDLEVSEVEAAEAEAAAATTTTTIEITAGNKRGSTRGSHRHMHQQPNGNMRYSSYTNDWPEVYVTVDPAQQSASKRQTVAHPEREASPYGSGEVVSSGLGTGTGLSTGDNPARAVYVTSSASMRSGSHWSNAEAEAVYRERMLQSLKIPWEALRIVKIIGHGGFGVVYKAQWKNEQVAVKQLNLKRDSPESADALRDEALAMCELKHPRIAPVYGYIDDGEHQALVMKYYKAGALSAQFPHPEYSTLPLTIRVKIGQQVAAGMQYLHEKGMLHGDLKTSNLLIDEAKGVVITDFGLSSMVEQAVTRAAMTVQISPPEVLLHPTAPRGKPVDVYAFGIVLWEIVTGRAAYQGLDRKVVKDLVLAGRRPTIPNSMLPSMKQLVQACWAQDPADRPTFDQVADMLELIRQEVTLATDEPEEATTLTDTQVVQGTTSTMTWAFRSVDS